MTGFDDDRELDDFLARRSVTHRRLADRDSAEPSPELDRLVLDKARQAIGTPADLPVHRAPRWAMPVALAATVVLAFAVVLNMGRVDLVQHQTAASANRAADTTALLESPQPEVVTHGLAANAPVTVAAPPPPQAPSAEPSLAPQLTHADKQTRIAVTALAKVRPSPPPPPPAADVAMPADVAEASNESAASTTLTASAAAPPSESRTIEPAKREMTASSTLRDSSAPEDAATPRARAKTDAFSGALVGALSADSNTSEAGAVTPVPEAKRANPQAWLREIEALRKAGKSTEADRELADFRKRYPNEPTTLPRDPRPVQ